MKRREFAKMMTAAVAGMLAGAKVLPALAQGSDAGKDACSGKDGCSGKEGTTKDTCQSADGKDTCKSADDSSGKDTCKSADGKDTCRSSDDSSKTKESCGAK